MSELLFLNLIQGWFSGRIIDSNDDVIVLAQGVDKASNGESLAFFSLPRLIHG